MNAHDIERLQRSQKGWRLAAAVAFVALIVVAGLSTWRDANPVVTDTLDRSDQSAIYQMCPGGTIVWPSDQDTFTCWGSDPMPADK